MKVKFIKWKNIETFCGSDHLKNKAFRQFHQRATYSDWDTPKDIIETFSRADLVPCKKVNLGLYSMLQEIDLDLYADIVSELKL